MRLSIVICVKRTAADVLRVNNRAAISLYSKTAQTYRSWGKGSNKHAKKVFIVEQILLVSTKGNVWTTVWTICMLFMGFHSRVIDPLSSDCEIFLGIDIHTNYLENEISFP